MQKCGTVVPTPRFVSPPPPLSLLSHWLLFPPHLQGHPQVLQPERLSSLTR